MKNNHEKHCFEKGTCYVNNKYIFKTFPRMYQQHLTYCNAVHVIFFGVSELFCVGNICMCVWCTYEHIMKEFTYKYSILRKKKHFFRRVISSSKTRNTNDCAAVYALIYDTNGN